MKQTLPPEQCTLLIILSTSSIQTNSGNTRLLIAGIRFSDIVHFLCVGCDFMAAKITSCFLFFFFLRLFCTSLNPDVSKISKKKKETLPAFKAFSADLQTDGQTDWLTHPSLEQGGQRGHVGRTKFAGRAPSVRGLRNEPPVILAPWPLGPPGFWSLRYRKRDSLPWPTRLLSLLCVIGSLCRHPGDNWHFN